MGLRLKKVDIYQKESWKFTHRFCLGLKLDAQTALDYVTVDPSLSKTPIVSACSTTLSELTSFQILYGQSIGGAVAIDLASRNPSAVRSYITFIFIFLNEHNF